MSDNIQLIQNGYLCMYKQLVMVFGLFLVVPTPSEPTVKNKAKAAAKITCALVTAVATATIFYNMTKTAERRLANPEYTGSRSPLAILKQLGTMLWNRKALSLFIAANVINAGITFCSAVEDIKSDAQELKENIK